MGLMDLGNGDVGCQGRAVIRLAIRYIRHLQAVLELDEDMESMSSLSAQYQEGYYYHYPSYHSYPTVSPSHVYWGQETDYQIQYHPTSYQ
uniref:Uncharacterized protein n=1 Tax=Timema poppense TaxID=170557 RepID=A0A7R9DNU3_TIMPO|nr:unnamed protein product [Timema poppensis]